MATYYLDSGAGGAADSPSPTNGDNWTSPWATFDYAIQQLSAGDLLYIASRHTEGATGALSRTLTGSEASRITLISADESSGTPPTTYENMVDGGGTINTSGGDSQYVFGWCDLYGLKFENSNSSGSFDMYVGSDSHSTFHDCYVKSGKGGVTWGTGTRSYSEYHGCTNEITGTNAATALLGMSNSGSNCYCKNCRFLYTGAGMTPTVASVSIGATETLITFEDCEFDTTQAWTKLLNLSSDDRCTWINFLRCRSVATLTDAIGSGTQDFGTRLVFDKCGGDYDHTTNEYEGVYVYQDVGAVTTDYAAYRDSGATDGGGNNFSWKFDADAVDSAHTPDIYRPVYSQPLQLFIPKGSRTLRFYVASNAEINNETFWIEVASGSEATSANHFPRTQSSQLTNILGTASNLTADTTSTWTGGAPVGTKRQIDFSIKPKRDALVTVRAFMAADRVIYLDPAIYEA